MNTHGSLDVDYLTKQNRKLRLELKESLAIGHMHKEALMRLTEKMGEGNQVIRTLCQLLQHSGEQDAKSRLRDQVFTLQGQIMVLQKIVNQTYENEKETYLLLADQFRKVQEENAKMEHQLHKFYEKIGEVDYLSGLVTKYKEIVLPSDLALAAKHEQEQLLDMLNLQREQIRKLTDEKDKLLKINVRMKEEVERKKDEVKNMTMMILQEDKFETNPNNGSMILGELEQEQSRLSQSVLQMRHNLSSLNHSTAPNLNTTLNFVKLQRELIKQVDEDNYQSDSQSSDEEIDCPQLSMLFPDKVQQIRTSRAEARVPYLNMKKVRELMMRREEKFKKEMEAEGHHVNPTNKIIQLEGELDITRKELTSQMLKFRTMADDHKKMVLHIAELENRNSLLATSNATLSQNYHRVYNDYQLCKSVTNEVERVLGKQITQNNLLDAREELSTFIMVEQKQDDDRLANIVHSIFRQRNNTQRRKLSPD